MLGQNGMGSNISREPRNPPQDGRQLVLCSMRSQMKNFSPKPSKRQRFAETFGCKIPVAGVSENANFFGAL